MREAMWVDLEVLTPSHVGSGSDINPIEYWINEGFARVHMDRLFADPDFGSHFDTFMTNAATQRYLGEHLPAELLNRHIRYQVSLTPEARQYLVRHQVQVKEHIKSAGRVFIPGSSIKGSLLSALINHVLEDACKSPVRKQSVETCIAEPRRFSQLLDITIGDLRSPGDGLKDRFYRWIDVSDSCLFTPEESLHIYYSEVVGARKGKLPVLFEGLAPETRWIFSLTAAPESKFSVSEMLQISDAFYRTVWKKSGISEAPPEKGYLLRIGQGSSAWATSLLIFAESSGAKYRFSPPRTRKLVDARVPMGWVVLSQSEYKSFAEVPHPVSSDGRIPGLGRTGIEPGSSTVTSPEEPPAKSPAAKETRIWRNVNLSWDPGSQTVVAMTPEGKAFTKGGPLIPESIYERLCVKRKFVRADIEVEPAGGKNFKIISIEPVP
jgi:hypothetical protein